MGAGEGALPVGGIPTCVILAAGESRKLATVGPDRPKPLARLLGLSLGERLVASCVGAGVRRFVVVVGHRADEVRDHFERVAALRGCRVEFATAEQWRRGSGSSALAAATLVPAGPFLLAMADLLVAPALVEHLLAAPPGPGETCAAVDAGHRLVPDRDQATLVRQTGERIDAIGKHLPLPSGAGTGLFYCTRELFGALERAAARGEHQLTDGLRELASEGRLRAVDVTGEPWFDVATPEVYRLARRRLLASLAKGGEDGFVSAHLNRRLSVRLSARLAGTSITPNQISVSAFLVALAGAALMALGDYGAQLVGALLVQASSIADGCDGEIARLKHLVTARGAWLDTILDRYADLAVVFALCFAEAAGSSGVRPWVGGFVAGSGFLLASYVTKEFALRHKRDYPHDVLDRLKRRDLRLFGIFCGALFGAAFDAMVALGILSHLCVFGILLRGWRRGPFTYRPA